MDNATGSGSMASDAASALTSPASAFDMPQSSACDDKMAQGLDAVFDVPVRVQAILGRARMPIVDLMAMKPGTVVELDRRIGESVDILVNNRLIARGEVVMIDNMLGVTLTEIVRQDN
ncbi:flagellar motor switch protein FliN [Sphingobium sp. B2]|uniref:flagellar motor switch protein FliN n=1 Tax=Sphingobium sp. B2 TaxID=2583228 RepID=UPI00164377A8|nr:flagellar motor switch protein FliN [Sphingobium sp. B2]